MHDLQALEARLARLERSHRRWRGLALLAGAAALGLGLAAPDDGVAETVRARSFVLIGEDGADAGRWDLDGEDRPYLQLQSGQASASLTMNGPALLLRGEDGKRGAFLGVDAQGDARLEVRSERYVDGARLVAKSDGSTGLYLLDGLGRDRAAVEHLEDGNSQFTARNAAGEVRATFGLDARGLPNLLLLDSLGRRRIGMLVQTTSGDLPLFGMEDGQGRTRVELTMDGQGEPRIRTYRPDGQPSSQTP